MKYQVRNTEQLAAIEFIFERLSGSLEDDRIPRTQIDEVGAVCDDWPDSRFSLEGLVLFDLFF